MLIFASELFVYYCIFNVMFLSSCERMTKDALAVTFVVLWLLCNPARIRGTGGFQGAIPHPNKYSPNQSEQSPQTPQASSRGTGPPSVGDEVLDSSQEALHVTERSYLKLDWCKHSRWNWWSTRTGANRAPSSTVFVTDSATRSTSLGTFIKRTVRFSRAPCASQRVSPPLLTRSSVLDRLPAPRRSACAASNSAAVLPSTWIKLADVFVCRLLLSKRPKLI